MRVDEIETLPVIVNDCGPYDFVAKNLKEKYEYYLPHIMAALNLKKACPIRLVDKNILGVAWYSHVDHSIYVYPPQLSNAYIPVVHEDDDRELLVLAHELQHVKQLQDGRFQVSESGIERNYNTEFFTYGGEAAYTKEEYWDLPWEANANTCAGYVMEKIKTEVKPYKPPVHKKEPEFNVNIVDYLNMHVPAEAVQVYLEGCNP